MTAPGVHSFSVAQRTDKRFMGHPVRYQAICDCGWTGEERREEIQAEGDGFAHKAMAVKVPDDLPPAA